MTLTRAVVEREGMVSDFAAKWPVLSVREVRKKLGHDAFRRLEWDAPRSRL